MKSLKIYYSLILLFIYLPICSCTQRDIDIFNNMILSRYNPPLQRNHNGENIKYDITNTKTKFQDNIIPNIIPIKGLLPPYDSTLSFDKQYPRIAVTVISAPENHRMPLGQDLTDINGSPVSSKYICQARIWKNSTSYSDTEKFIFDVRSDSPRGVPLRDYERLQISPLGIFLNNSWHTGSKRTKGPKPPEKPFPDDRKHMEFFHKAVSPVESGIVTPDQLVMISLAYYAGVEPRYGDRRFWIANFEDVNKN